jgi:hypothetical protein
MLENKEAVFQDGKIVAFRIVTGEEIIGKVTSFDAHSVSLKKPCTLTITQEGMGLMPASVLGNPEKDVTYQRSAIVATVTPRDDAVSSYEAYATGLVMPKNDGIVTSAK